MSDKSNIFTNGTKEQIWQRYCGFLDLSVAEFIEIQEHLLTEQIELISNTQVGKSIIKEEISTLEEFRHNVPITSYEDYAPYIGNRQDDALLEKPYRWVRSTGYSGSTKWIPYTKRAFDWMGRSATAATLLCCADDRGEVGVENNVRVLNNLPLNPFLSGVIAEALSEEIELQLIPPVDEQEELSFEARTTKSFERALQTGVDVITSLSSVLIKIGEMFTETPEQLKMPSRITHPRALWRLITSYLRTKFKKQKLLPKDVWPLKGLISHGMESGIYGDRIAEYWGKQLLEYYGTAEAGLIAMQAWNKNFLNFTPFSCFLEFLPEKEWLKSKKNKKRSPTTLLLDELVTGESYLLVITSFYGMPFLRYNTGDIIRITDAEDMDAEIILPQMVFARRADEIIELSEQVGIDEKTIWQALLNTGIKYNSWIARQEMDETDRPIIHLYIEPRDGTKTDDLTRLMGKELKNINKDYRELDLNQDEHLLKVTTVTEDTFQQYRQSRQNAGYEISRLLPARINASDSDLTHLLNINKAKTVGDHKKTSIHEQTRNK